MSRVLDELDPETRAQVEDLLKNYSGHLSPAELAAGIATVIENATSVMEDVELLVEHGRYGRALTLSFTALEEVGKVKVLQSMSHIGPRSQKHWKGAWKKFRSHGAKSTHGYATTYDDMVRREPVALIFVAVEQMLLSGLAERMRQVGLYVDFSSMGRSWYSPKHVTREEALKVAATAEEAVSRMVALQEAGMFSEEVLELQNELYGPLREKYPFETAPETIDLKSLRRDIIATAREFYRRLGELGIDLGVDMEEVFASVTED